MEVGQVGSASPTTATFGPQGLSRGGRTRQSAPTQQALQPAVQRTQTSTQPSATTAALQQVNQDLDSLTGKLDDLIGALTKFIDARKPSLPAQDPNQPQAPAASANQGQTGTKVADPKQVTPQQTQKTGQTVQSGQASKTAQTTQAGQTGQTGQTGQAPSTGGTPAVEVGGDGDININILINVDLPAGGQGGAGGASGAGGAGGGQQPQQDKPVKVEIVQPPPPPPPPPPPTQVMTSDFGSLTINGKQTFLGTVFGIFFDPPKAADYIAGVLNANPDNGGITASMTNDGRVVLTSKTPGATIRIDDLQAESDGDSFNNALSGFTKGQSGTGTLTGNPVSLFDPTKVDNSDPNRPPILRGS